MKRYILHSCPAIFAASSSRYSQRSIFLQCLFCRFLSPEVPQASPSSYIFRHVGIQLLHFCFQVRNVILDRLVFPLFLITEFQLLLTFPGVSGIRLLCCILPGCPTGHTAGLLCAFRLRDSACCHSLNHALFRPAFCLPPPVG